MELKGRSINLLLCASFLKSSNVQHAPERDVRQDRAGISQSQYNAMGTIISWYKLEQSAAVPWAGRENCEPINSFLAFLFWFLSRVFHTHAATFTRASWVPTFFLLRCSQLRKKSRQQKHEHSPPLPAAQEGWAGRHWEYPGSHRITSVTEDSFGCDAPLWFCCNDGAEPNTSSWALQAGVQREYFPLPNGPSVALWRDRLGCMLPHRLYTAPFPSVTWKFSLQYHTGSNCFVTPNY